jgi:uncharacterized iron-regulated membrane protein
MTSTLRRLHIWAGLFSFTALLVMAVAGLHATLRPFAGGDEDAAAVSEQPYRAGSGWTDAEVAADLARELRLPLPDPLPRGALRRNARRELEVRLDTQSGPYLLTVLEAAQRVRVEHRRNALGEFLTLLHARTFVGTRGPLPIHLWALYVDLSIAALLFLVSSGVWLWLTSRPALLWARALFAASGLLFATLWWAIR